MSNKKLLYGSVIALFVIIFAIAFIKSPIIKFILFCLFSALIGITLSYRIDTNNPEELEIVKKSFITTIIIFISICLAGFFLAFMGVIISPIIGIILFIILLILIIVIFILTLTGQYPFYHKIIAGITIFLFSIFILYDTSNILNNDYSGDFISASLDYFLDFINIFSSLLNLSE